VTAQNALLRAQPHHHAAMPTWSPRPSRDQPTVRTRNPRSGCGLIACLALCRRDLLRSWSGALRCFLASLLLIRVPAAAAARPANAKSMSEARTCEFYTTHPFSVARPGRTITLAACLKASSQHLSAALPGNCRHGAHFPIARSHPSRKANLSRSSHPRLMAWNAVSRGSVARLGPWPVLRPIAVSLYCAASSSEHSPGPRWRRVPHTPMSLLSRRPVYASPSSSSRSRLRWLAPAVLRLPHRVRGVPRGSGYSARHHGGHGILGVGHGFRRRWWALQGPAHTVPPRPARSGSSRQR